MTLFAEKDRMTPILEDKDGRFGAFHELMAKKVQEVLLVASPYDAFVMEQHGSLAHNIIHEYRGLNLSRPPRLTLVSHGSQAMDAFGEKPFDLVIVVPNPTDHETMDLGRRLKEKNPGIRVLFLTHSAQDVGSSPDMAVPQGVDQVFFYTGEPYLLLSLIKNVEDRLNVDTDVRLAQVPVLILVEDSPLFCSYMLPLIYKEVVRQTQAVIEESVNQEHRLLKMRARPKILTARTFEQAMDLYAAYEPYVMGVISDTRYPKNGRMEPESGLDLLSAIKAAVPHMPLLLLSSESENKHKAAQRGLVFIDKNTPDLSEELHRFFMEYLGFGDFIFRTQDKKELARAKNMVELEKVLPEIPEEPLLYMAQRNRFSRWLQARSEIDLARKLAQKELSDFANIREAMEYIIKSIRETRRRRELGIVTRFFAKTFDPEINTCVQVGEGSLGGKGLGLAFLSNLLRSHPDLETRFKGIEILIPKMAVIATDGFDVFVHKNNLNHLASCACNDAEVAEKFMAASFPGALRRDLKAYLAKARFPLAVRSSNLLEDTHFNPYAGLFQTKMLSNHEADLNLRLEKLETAVKLVWASTYFEGPRNFSKGTLDTLRKNAMAVVIQELVGDRVKNCFYPTFSGVARSHNFYPVLPMKMTDGMAELALGFGKIIDEDGGALRFSPKHPTVLPQFSTVDDILANAQRYFYALDMSDDPLPERAGLFKRQVADAEKEPSVRLMSATYIPEEHRIRQGRTGDYPLVPTFASLLGQSLLPLPDLLCELLEICQKGAGCPVELEFSGQIRPTRKKPARFALLQMRPMAAGIKNFNICISDEEIQQAICHSTHGLGHGIRDDFTDIVYVKPEAFDPGQTRAVVGELARLNAVIAPEKRPYLLMGPGRWGSADRFLGIPVQWVDIWGAKAIVELRNASLKADPSQGSHFFQNITSKGVFYLTVTEQTHEFVHWDWFNAQPKIRETKYLRHVRPKHPFTVKMDGRTGGSVVLTKILAKIPGKIPGKK